MSTGQILITVEELTTNMKITGDLTNLEVVGTLATALYRELASQTQSSPTTTTEEHELVATVGGVGTTEPPSTTRSDI
jgi:hypothetical protein